MLELMLFLGAAAVLISAITGRSDRITETSNAPWPETPRDV